MPGNPHDAFFAASRQNPLNVEIVLPVPGVMSFPAPTRGWIESDNVTTAPKTSAAILENFFPTQESARLRGGCRMSAWAGETIATLEPAIPTRRIAVHYITLIDGFSRGKRVRLLRSDFATEVPNGGAYFYGGDGPDGGDGTIDLYGIEDEGVWDDPENAGGYVVGTSNTGITFALGKLTASPAFTDGATIPAVTRTTHGNAPVDSLFVYNGLIPKMFAAVANTDAGNSPNGYISEASENLASDKEIEDLRGSVWSTTHLANSSGRYLIGVNGEDHGFRYDGAAFTRYAPSGQSNEEAIEGVHSSKLSMVWNFKERLYFVEKGTFKVWYLGSKAFRGTATALDLGALFELGGALLFGATFSSDAGDDVTDRCVFVTTEGEVAIFSGLYPGDSNWSLDGRYVIGPPLGRNAFFRAGGDLGILTGDGIVSLSNVVKLDRSAVSARSLSRGIQSSWRDAAASGDHPWSATMWRNRGTLLISASPKDTDPQCFVMNTETGAWCRYTGWDVRCAVVFQHGLYFGREDGLIVEAENGGNDLDPDGNPIGYVGVYVPKFQGLSRPRRKHSRFGKVSFKGSSPSFDLIALSDYDTSILNDLPDLDALESDAPVNTLTSSGTDPQAFDYTPQWDDGSATWDAGPEFKWDETIRNYSPGSLEYRRNRARAATSAVYTMQRTTGAMGYALSLALVTEANSVGAPVFEIMASSLQYEECRSAF